MQMDPVRRLGSAFAARLDADLRRHPDRPSKDDFARTLKAVEEAKADGLRLSIGTYKNRASGALPKDRRERVAFCGAAHSHLAQMLTDAGAGEPSWSPEEFADEPANVLALEFEPAAERRQLPAPPSGQVRPVGFESYFEATLDDWQSAFWEVYSHKDQDLKLHDMMLQLVVDATRLTEAIRKQRYDEALTCLPRVFSWICSMSLRAAIAFPDLSPSGNWLAGIIWDKYPGVCALCAEPRCLCPTWNTDELTDAERRQIEEDRKERINLARQTGQPPVTLDEWVDMFESIYGTVNATRDSATKVLHFWEEVGELEVELRKADRVLNRAVPPDQAEAHRVIWWEAELADVFSWLSSVYLHIRGYLRNADRLLGAYEVRVHVTHYEPQPIRLLPFSEWVWLEFGTGRNGVGLKCHRCGNAICDCNIGFDRR